MFEFLFGNNWQEINKDEVPEWAQQRLSGTLKHFQYRIVKGNHFLYKKWDTAEIQGGSIKYFKKWRK